VVPRKNISSLQFSIGRFFVFKMSLYKEVDKMKEYRTYTCNQIGLEDVGKKVRIAGFVQTIRDFGGLVFLDIRDMYGITQVVTSRQRRRCRHGFSYSFGILR